MPRIAYAVKGIRLKNFRLTVMGRCPDNYDGTVSYSAYSDPLLLLNIRSLQRSIS
jgi:hypothetical protein